MEVALTAEGFKKANAHAMSTGDQEGDWLYSIFLLHCLFNGINYYHNTETEAGKLTIDKDKPEISYLITKDGKKRSRSKNSIEEKNGIKYLVLRMWIIGKIQYAWSLPLKKGRNKSITSKDNIFEEDEYGGYCPNLPRYLEI